MKMILYMALSIDGIAALDSRTGIERYGSREDHDFFIGESKKCDAALMGKNTASFKISGVPNVILTHDSKLQNSGDGRLYLWGDPKEIYSELERRGFKKVALLGGPFTNAQFLRQGLVDEMFLTVEPVTIGQGLHFLNEALESRWTLADTKILNKKGSLVLHYKKTCEKKQNSL